MKQKVTFGNQNRYRNRHTPPKKIVNMSPWLVTTINFTFGEKPALFESRKCALANIKALLFDSAEPNIFFANSPAGQTDEQLELEIRTAIQQYNSGKANDDYLRFTIYDLAKVGVCSLYPEPSYYTLDDFDDYVAETDTDDGKHKNGKEIADAGIIIVKQGPKTFEGYSKRKKQRTARLEE